MAGSVIDSLVVTLGLDSKAFSEGVRGSTEQLAGFTRRLAGMFLAVRGLEDVVGYFKDLHAQLAEIGFTSKNLGVAGTELRRLGEVSELFGGQMQDAVDSVTGLQQAVFGLRFKGQMSESLMMLQRFGVAYLDAAGHARNFRDIAMDASKAIERQARVAGLNAGERFQLAQSMGFTGGIASAVAQGGKGLEDALKTAQTDQKSLTEKAIQGQVALDRSMTRLQQSTAAQSAAILQRLAPVVGKAVQWLQKLANDLLPKIAHALDQVINFFRNPPAWFKPIEELGKQLSQMLGPIGTLAAGIAGLAGLMGAGSALVEGLMSLAAVVAPLGAAIAAGVGVGALIDKIPGVENTLEKGWAKVFDFFGVGSETGKAVTATSPGRTPFPAPSERFGTITRAPQIPPPTPTAPRQPSAAEQSAGAGAGAPGTPTAMAGSSSTNVQIDSITVNTRATDANGIAGDLNSSLQRKLLVANADQGQG